MTTTLRNYLSVADLAKIANISVLDNDEALRQLDRAEEAIDDYVGYHEKAVPINFRGIITSISSDGLTIIDTSSNTQLHQLTGYYSRCVIEIIDGTGIGQVRYITSSSYADYSVTIIDAWDTKPDTTSSFRIYQLAQFPRNVDVYPRPDGLQLYKTLPDALKKAVAAQIEYMIAQGDAFFQGSNGELVSESIGNYSYNRGNNSAAPAVRLVSPRVRSLLLAYKNSGGQLVNDNPTSL